MNCRLTPLEWGIESIGEPCGWAQCPSFGSARNEDTSTISADFSRQNSPVRSGHNMCQLTHRHRATMETGQRCAEW